jgi:hypothetical protein
MCTPTFPLVGANTVRAIVVVSLWLPDLPVMVTVDGPVTAEFVTESVRMQVAGVAPGRNDPTTPLGRPEKLNATVLVKPFCAVKERLLFPVPPRVMLRAAGDADNVKVSGRVMLRAMVVLAIATPEVPVMVTVAVAAAALLAAVNVTGLPRPAIIEPAVAVTPAGSPDTESAATALKPL